MGQSDQQQARQSDEEEDSRQSDEDNDSQQQTRQSDQQQTRQSDEEEDSRQSDEDDDTQAHAPPPDHSVPSMHRGTSTKDQHLQQHSMSPQETQPPDLRVPSMVPHRGASTKTTQIKHLKPRS